jgi:DNA-binding response OmpR family regulator
MEKLVFIIDDDQVYLDFMKSHFRQMKGYCVEAYPGGDAALKALESKDPFLIILDHHLSDPTKDGIYFLKKIRSMKPDVPSIYITSNASQSVKSKAIKNGAKSLIVKSESFLVQLRTAMDEIGIVKKRGILSKIFR